MKEVFKSFKPRHSETCLSGVCGQRRPRSACASAQSDQSLHCPLTEALDTTECMNEEQIPGRYFAHVQEDLNLFILRMFEGTFSLDTAHLHTTYVRKKYFELGILWNCRKNETQKITEIADTV